MSQAIFTFTHPTSGYVEEIRVDLLDWPGARAWMFAVYLNSCERKIYSLRNLYQPPVWDKLAPIYETLLNTVNDLQKTTYPYQFPMPSTVDRVDQAFLNHLHRHFTESSLHLWSPTTIDYRTDKHSINRILQQLNSIIHTLEYYMITKQKQQWNNSISELWLEAAGDQQSFYIDPYRWNHHGFEHADLVLDAHILGKTLIESYYCGDDPTHWDTMGHNHTSGGCMMLLNDTRSRIYASEEFKTWLRNHNTNYDRVFGDWPLGTFVEGYRERAIKLFNTPDISSYSCTIEIAF
jgi:hypothetical protein